MKEEGYMDNDDVMIGKVSERAQKLVGLTLRNNDRCYLREETVRSFASPWKDSYLSKIKEGRKMIRSPRYLAIDKEGKLLYFLRDYPLEGGGIRFAGAVCSYKKQLQLLDIRTFEGSSLYELVWIKASN